MVDSARLLQLSRRRRRPGRMAGWHPSLQPAEGPPELQIRLPDVAAGAMKSTGSNVKDLNIFDWGHALRVLIILSFYCPLAVPRERERERGRERERTKCTGRKMRKKRAAGSSTGVGAKKRGRPCKQMKLTDSTDEFLRRSRTPRRSSESRSRSRGRSGASFANQ